MRVCVLICWSLLLHDLKTCPVITAAAEDDLLLKIYVYFFLIFKVQQLHFADYASDVQFSRDVVYQRLF